MRNSIVSALILGAVAMTAAACEDKKPEGPAPTTSGSGASMATDSAKAMTPPPAPKKPMAEMQMATIDALIAAENARDAKKYAAVFSPTTTVRMAPMPDMSGREAVAEHMTKIFSAFPDAKVSKGRVWQKGNVAVVEWMAAGTNSGEWMGQKATGRPMGFVAVTVNTFDDDGMIKEAHSYVDGMTIKSQLDPKAAPGSFRAPPTTPLSADVHMSKGTPEEQKNLDAANNVYKLIDDHKTADVLALMSDDATMVDYTQPADMKGKKAFTEFFGMIYKAIPDFKQTRGTQIAADDYVVTEGAMVGTQKGAMGPLKASNKPINVHFVDVLQMKDGKMVKLWSYGNSVEMLVQTGVIPMPGAMPAASGSAAPMAAPTAGRMKAK
jgi:steroid delta-isomerase-like uncharacterized protein